MNWVVALPVIIPLAAGALTLAFWRSLRYQRLIALAGTLSLLAISLYLLNRVVSEDHLVLQMGNWSAPVGISLVMDRLSAIMVVLTGIIAVAIALFSLGATPVAHQKFGYYPLMHLLLAGVAGSFITGDIFNLFVWFEVMLLSSFALLTLGGDRAQMEGATKYVTLNLFSSAIFLSAVGLLYGTVGTLNMADIGAKLATVEHRGIVNVLAMMFMLSFGIKAAAFPLFFWLPASYHTPLVAVSALFAGLLTKVGVYALYRVFSLIFIGDTAFTHTLLLWAGTLTMVTGVLGAAAQFEFRRILSFHIISQIGYMILGLAVFSPIALIGGVFYIMHHIIVKTNLFLVSGVVYRLRGTYDLKKLGGVYRDHPWIAIWFLIPALSLAGIPPLSGFFAKFIIIRSTIAAEEWVVTVAALLVGLLTLFSMVKIWAEVFWKKAPDSYEPPAEAPRDMAWNNIGWLLTPIILLAACTLAIGFFGQSLYELAESTAHQLLNPQGYIDAVLGGRS